MAGPARPVNGNGLNVPATRAADPLETAVRALLTALGEDPARAGLRETPRRVAAALRELTSGRDTVPESTLTTTFEDTFDDVVLVDGLPLVSLCEHHLLPFTGTVTVAYVPDGRIVGLSKLARLVDATARRLQVQERLTREIADAVDAALAPAGVAVIARATHACMSLRGARASAWTTTTAYRGVLDAPDRRREVLALAHADGGTPRA